MFNEVLFEKLVFEGLVSDFKHRFVLLFTFAYWIDGVAPENRLV